MGFRTKQVHAGVEPDPTTGALITPIHQTTTYLQPSVDEYMTKGYAYSRTHNPTVRALENKLTALEEGVDCTAFSTGMAAINAVFVTFLSAGDHAIVSDIVYGGTYRLATKIFSRFGVEFTFADTSDSASVEAALQPNTRLIFTETPANPTLKLTDLRAVSDIARGREIPHAVDNTFLTPYYQRPIELGVDLVVHSTTKYLDGHNATVGGCVVSSTAELDEQLRFVQNATGSIMSPQVAWLTMQGCKTLAERMDRQTANAMAAAQFLQDHPKVEMVGYPGLESFPQYDLAKRQASGFGAMLWFEVAGGVTAGKKLMDALELWSLAENLGAVESLVTHPASMTHADIEPEERARVGISDGLVRLSAGLEDAEDLIADLDQGLAQL